jgi:hypothetical protein
MPETHIRASRSQGEVGRCAMWDAMRCDAKIRYARLHSSTPARWHTCLSACLYYYYHHMSERMNIRSCARYTNTTQPATQPATICDILHMHIHARTCTHMHMHTHAHTHIHTHMHELTRTYTHIHTHMHGRRSVMKQERSSWRPSRSHVPPGRFSQHGSRRAMILKRLSARQGHNWDRWVGNDRWVGPADNK